MTAAKHLCRTISRGRTRSLFAILGGEKGRLLRTMIGFIILCLIIAPNSSMAEDYRAEAQAAAESIRTAGLCGQYVANAGASLIDQLTFKARNVVEVEISALAEERFYLIQDNQVTIRGDKAYFSLEIRAKELVGLDRWTKGVVFVKATGQPRTCGGDEIDEGYLAGLAAELCHADGVALQGTGQLSKAANHYLVCCGLDGALSCNHYGVLKKLMGRDVNTASEYFRRACDLGYGGGCSNLAEIQTKSGHHDSAIGLHKEACDKGFKVSCLKASPEGYELFAK